MFVPHPYVPPPSSRELLRALTEVGEAGALTLASARSLALIFGDRHGVCPAEVGVGTPYEREVLFEGAAGEIMLAAWRSQMPCAPHDHGVARGAVLIVRGHFRERRYAFDGHQLSIEGTSTVRAGDVVRVAAGAIHDMECVAGAGITLHFYAPSPGPTRLYDAVRRETVVAACGVGAWLPATATREVLPWSEAPLRRS